MNHPYELANVWANFPFQAGLVFHKKIKLFITRTNGVAFTKYIDFLISSESYSGGVRYLFGRKDND